VSTGEVVPHRRVAVSGYRVNRDRNEAFADISDFTGTVAVGINDRVELFGGFRFYTRIDADRRPLLSIGAPVDYPRLTLSWADGVGDFYAGAKFNITSQWRQQPAAFAIRGMVKIPSGDEDKGLGSGKVDFLIDAIVSKEFQEQVELAGTAGFAVRADPDGVNVSNGFRWGVGAAFPSRRPLRVVAEFQGERYFDDTVTASGSPVAFDLSRLPSSYGVRHPADAFVGLQFQHRRGFFAGAGVSFAAALDPRSDFPGANDETGDRLGFQARIGFHPGARIYVAPAPPPPPPPPPPAANRPPTVRARCEPCTVQTGRSSTVTADAQDPDGDTLTYRWSAPAGSFANQADRQTIWTAPDQEGAVPTTVTVDDGKGGTASDAVTIQVVRPPAREYRFEDVHFDFDRYSLRPEASRVLDEVVKALQDNPELRIEVEGHTCNIGTAEYNLALGERRANAVKDYLASHGIGADRLRTVSYGEERPKHDNTREETRRLNRRAALVIRMQ
jgi:outer membrane protein OmpA-like peptidoglycan-associated protein